ncbi:hypothetical protein QIS74_05380 [Colletotrichum tabaci]|uniref:Uncharacterized protein n=1 Tax=Colletotrichum tabaci TaxID=1209068 RepID=A0AAV9TIT0_9PEZI
MRYSRSNTTSAFVTCDPVATPTNVYTTTAIAASPTTSWVATYTITEVCTGWPWEYKTKVIPSLLRRDHHLLRALRAKIIPIICPIPTPTANVVINGNGVTDAANPVITGAGDGANYQHRGGQTGGGSNPGGNGQNNNPNGAPSGSAGQAPGYVSTAATAHTARVHLHSPASLKFSVLLLLVLLLLASLALLVLVANPGGQPGQSAVPGAP